MASPGGILLPAMLQRANSPLPIARVELAQQGRSLEVAAGLVLSERDQGTFLVRRQRHLNRIQHAVMRVSTSA
jgi:hypothetical protein